MAHLVSLKYKKPGRWPGFLYFNYTIGRQVAAGH